MARRASRKTRKTGGLTALVVTLLGGAGALFYACESGRLPGPFVPSGGEGQPRPRPSATAGATKKDAGAAPSPGGGKRDKVSARPIHLELGTPEDGDPADDKLLVKPEYALSYDPTRNVANWVSWQLAASWFGDAPRNKGKFLEDASLPAGVYRVKHDDYTGSGFDRGHMVRSEERTRSPEENKATFLMTNILPQTHDLNAGPWLRLEEHCEARARRQGRQLFVVAGGVLPRGKARGRVIGHDVTVPDTFFKIVVELDPGQGAEDVREATPTIAVLMPNDTGIIGEDWEKYRTSIDEIEKRTGYDFLSAVDEAVQARIEARRE
jgi:endonuclease G, mitochondrial